MRRLMQERDLSCNYKKRAVIMYNRCDCVDYCDAIVLWFHLLMSSSRHVPVMRRLMQKRHVSRNKIRESHYRFYCVDCCDAIELWFHLLISPSCHIPVMRRLMQKRHVSRNKN